MKTLAGWKAFTERTEKESIYAYLQVGDIVSEDMIDALTNILPIKVKSEHLLQLGEPYDFVRDSLSRVLTPIYMTFARCDGSPWRFYGNCYLWDNVDETRRLAR